MKTQFLKKLLAIVSLPFCLFGLAQAAPMFSNSAVVTAPTNTATFSSLSTNNIDLSAYQENGIHVTVPDATYMGFDAFNTGRTTQFFYGSGGNNSWVTISLVSGGSMTALDFLLGNGNPGEGTDLIWETFNGATSTGFGDLVLIKGTTVGWTDAAGFTSIRVASFSDQYGGLNAFGDFQAIAIDDVRVDSMPRNEMPEPESLALFGVALAGLGLTRHKSMKA